MNHQTRVYVVMFLYLCYSTVAFAQELASWKYSPDKLRPFWISELVDGESVLFIRETASNEARGSVLFPIREIVSVQSSSGDITYDAGIDYRFEVGSREIVIPVGSRIVTSTPDALRRPANTQKHQLTHRDGQGEILFGGNLEYHQLQTSVTYRKLNSEWPVAMPSFTQESLPLTLKKLQHQEDLSIVLLGDSISTGCNASLWGKGAPYQPAYQDLLVEHLRSQYRSNVKLANLSVGGTSTTWGMTMTEAVAQHSPDLVILAFGMNDSAGTTAEAYSQNIEAIVTSVRDRLPQTEFILVASMLGNRDWTRLNHDVFPQYRDVLAARCKPGIALADMTSVWEEMLRRKKDCDLTGNGVNHPNDFGHRIYAQVLSSLLVDPALPSL